MTMTTDSTTQSPQTRRRVLVLGATGFIGQRVCAALAATDWALPVASARRGAPLVLDATDGAALAAVVPQVDAIVSCMAGPPSAIVASAQVLAKVLRLQGDAAPPLVYLGSMAAYGNVQGLVDERAPLLGDLNAYADAKAQAERALVALPAMVSLRPGCVYGRGAPLWNTLVERLLRTQRLGDLGDAGAACSNLVHVEDVATAVLAVLRQDAREGAFNLAMADAPSWNGYFAAYAKALDLPRVAHVSARQLRSEQRVLGPALKLAELALRRLHPATAARLPPRLPTPLQHLWRQDVRLDARRAERELGMTWRPLAPALAQIVAPA